MTSRFDALSLPSPPEKEAYEAEIARLRETLLEAQAKLRDTQDRALLLVIAGLDGAGKGEVLNLLTHFLDTRHVRVYGFGAPTEDERARPLFLRYLDRVPPHGVIDIFFGSYYADALELGLKKGVAEAFSHELELIRSIEAMLAAERVTVVKLYLHLTKKQQG